MRLILVYLNLLSLEEFVSGGSHSFKSYQFPTCSTKNHFSYNVRTLITVVTFLRAITIYWLTIILKHRQNIITYVPSRMRSFISAYGVSYFLFIFYILFYLLPV